MGTSITYGQTAVLFYTNSEMSESLSELRRDGRIANSRVSRILQYATQAGGVAVNGYVATKLGGHASPEFFGGVASGIGLTGLGTRLGLERGSAARRQRVEAVSQEMGVQDIGLTATERKNAFQYRKHLTGVIGPMLINVCATLNGLIEGAKLGYAVPTEAWLPLATGLALIPATRTQAAGEHLNTRPILHSIGRW